MSIKSLKSVLIVEFLITSFESARLFISSSMRYIKDRINGGRFSSVKRGVAKTREFAHIPYLGFHEMIPDVKQSSRSIVSMRAILSFNENSSVSQFRLS